MNEMLPEVSPGQPADHPTEGVPVPRRRGLFRSRRRPAYTPPTPHTPTIETVLEPPAPEPRDTPAPVSQTSVARRTAVVLAILLAAVITVAFRGSWTSQSDAAKAAHFDSWGAWLYPFAPDGLIVLALVGAVVLRHKRWPRLYCLTVVVLFTITSYVVNHLHGLGTFVTVDGQLVNALQGWVVGLIAGQLVGSIAFGSHILMHVFRHLFPEALDGAARTIATPAATLTGPQSGPGHPADGVPADSEEDKEIRKQYAAIAIRMLLDNGLKPTRKRLAVEYGISERQVSYVIADVERERDADSAEDVDGGLPTRSVAPVPATTLAAVGSVNGHGPGGAA